MEALVKVGLPISHIERDPINKGAELFFSRALTPKEQTDAESVVVAALKNYHLRGIAGFDPARLKDMTLMQLNTYIDANVTDLASAKAFLKKLSALILYIINRRLDD